MASVSGRATIAGLCAAILGGVALFALYLSGEDPRGEGPPASPSTAQTGPATPTTKGQRAMANPSGVPMPVGDLPGWRQTFADDFTGGAVADHWFTYEGQPDNDPGGWFDPDHVSVGGGLLTIGAWREPARNDLYVTGGISNRNSFSQTYGRFDVRYRMEPGTGVAYALLLWPSTNTYPPEIDFAEDNGRDRRTLYTAVHPPDGSEVIGRSVDGDFTRWHTAGMEWTPGRVAFTLDGQVWATVTGAGVPSEPMGLALQTQAWFCGHTWEACPDDTTPARVNLEVDWVVAYASER